MVVITGISSCGLQKITDTACEMAGMDTLQCDSVNVLLEQIFQNDASVAVVELAFLGLEAGIFLDVAHRLHTTRQVIILATSGEEAKKCSVETGRGIVQVFTTPPPSATLSAFLLKAQESMHTGNMTGQEAPV